ncbi:MAG: RNA-binding domain-containing protein, partial [Pseudomonadota bacterium]
MNITSFNISTIEDIESLNETYTAVECKLAHGRDGAGALPKTFWETYSAFANTHGGIIILGVRETQQGFKLEGILNVQKIINELHNELNNPKKVSFNLLTDQDIVERTIDQKTIILVHVPQASRKQCPVFLNGNPLGNTYKRFGEGDRRCDDETVKRFLAEQVEPDRDGRILRGFTFENDINLETFQAYRMMFRDTKPSHPFLADSDFEFFKKMRGWRIDRETGQEGMTLAGLLMFGKLTAIQDAVPNYFLDYQENTDFTHEQRWTYRFITDGTWSGNLFDFYQKVYRRLIDDLDIPFLLKGAQRLDESTAAHAALREALINTLVHADYSGRLSVLVVKKRDTFIFRNPGGMRVPVAQAQQGGESDCRNSILHDLFLKIGLGEKAGSGVPKIYNGWKSCNWLPPKLYEKDEPEAT